MGIPAFCMQVELAIFCSGGPKIGAFDQLLPAVVEVGKSLLSARI
jgi:hypothetical protein